MSTRILVVDDMESHLYLAKSLLEPLGYQVVVASGKDEAISELEMDPSFDLIVSDISMPDASGFELIQEVKANDKYDHIPFVFITATYWGEADKRKGLGLGAAKFIFRPLEARAIVTEIEEVLPVEKRLSSPEQTKSHADE